MGKGGKAINEKSAKRLAGWRRNAWQTGMGTGGAVCLFHYLHFEVGNAAVELTGLLQGEDQRALIVDAIAGVVDHGLVLGSGTHLVVGHIGGLHHVEGLRSEFFLYLAVD